MIYLLLTILLSSSVFFLFFFLRQRKLSRQLRQDKQNLENSFSSMQRRVEELEQNLKKAAAETDSEKEKEQEKLAEKNRKLRQMSEAVYKEKKRVDEDLVKLSQEKEKLEQAKQKLDEKVKKLWATSTAVHKEKERINTLKQEIEQKHQEIVDSVNYAQRIQQAILPDRKEIDLHLPENLILFKPRDIVSGDFYWFSARGADKYIACVDCTGHGVPGAFMSMIGNTLLNQIVNEKGVVHTAEILDALNHEVTRVLKQNQEGSESRDGMDIGLSRINREENILEYSAANRPLYHIQQGNLIEIKGTKQAIGGHSFGGDKKFEQHTLQPQTNDCFYLSSDGFADQFNMQDKKFMTKRFKELLLQIQEHSMSEQEAILRSSIESWQDQAEQTDDILVIGIKM